ncbi:hypothetical protein PAXRUDRAFT_158727 [Paxillus rubicundulus Ve08.2h10]|uniref:Uncharacterized protein n=1 Tax=Paxillus rubicundulus Ve08.2h10 TaxID=930991 RepID=A0A0D0DGM8_9AGAM|nr:hypothetical protein PAXRUDRAFT_158727 [Paxillus rubicundulus Ve08.2h10]
MGSILNQLQQKLWTPDKYTDIFDGSMCFIQLKGPDGKLFFSNLPDGKSGPNSKLCIGVNLGVDW